MINLNEDRFKSTLKELSRDSTNNEYMTESEEMAIDFDEIKRIYIKDICPQHPPDSNDVLKYIGDEFYFIEFKNGNMKNIKSLNNKIFESLLMFSDITGKTISHTRIKGHYILVYNYENSKRFIRTLIEDRNERGCEKTLGSSEVQYSTYFDDIVFDISSLANYNLDFFGLRAGFEKMYFKTVKTYHIEEFETEFVDRYFG